MPDCQRCLYTLKTLCLACLSECMWYKVWFVIVMGKAKAVKQPVLKDDGYQSWQNIQHHRTYLDGTCDVEEVKEFNLYH